MPVKPVWIVLAVAGMGTYLLLVAAFADHQAFHEGMATLGAGGLVLLLCLSLFNYLLRFLRWQSYLREYGYHVPVLRHLLYYVAGFAFTLTPGKAGEAVRSLYLKQHGVAYSESLAILFVERFLDLAAVLVLAGFFAVTEPQYATLAGTVALVLVLTFVAVATGRMAALVVAVGRRLPPKSAGLFGHLADMFTQSRSMLAPRKLAAGLVVGIVGWGAEGYGLYLLCQALNVDLTVTAGASIYATAVLAGAAAFFLPGGIGGTELVMSALLVHQGATVGVALVATAICRTATLWFAVVLGFLSILLVHTGVSRPSARMSP